MVYVQFLLLYILVVVYYGNLLIVEMWLMWCMFVYVLGFWDVKLCCVGDVVILIVFVVQFCVEEVVEDVEVEVFVLVIEVEVEVMFVVVVLVFLYVFVLVVDINLCGQFVLF